MKTPQATFDPQAREFDNRVGLPAEAPLEVASAVVLKSVLRRGEWLLEVGCGTGELGVALGAELARRGNGYLGLDVSRGMLEVFRGRLQGADYGANYVPGTSREGRREGVDLPAGGAQTASGRPSGWVALRPRETHASPAQMESREVPGTSQEGAKAGILQADGEALWPVADGGVGAIFSSRALHLLEQEHVEAEVVRVLGERGGVLLVGRVVRPDDAPGTQLRRRLHRLLRREGFEGRGGRKRIKALFDSCCRRGAALIEPVPVLQWESEKRLARSLEAWHRRQGLAGLELPLDTKAEVLDRLRSWAEAAYGDLERGIPTEETYVLEGVHFPTGIEE